MFGKLAAATKRAGSEQGPSQQQMQLFDSILGCARDNDADSIRALVRSGCPPSYCNKVGQTALHIGAIWGSVDAVQALLEAKANPCAMNQLRGSTPLHAAAMGKGPADRRADCVKLMIQFKADPKQADFAGQLPLESADDEQVRLALGAAPLVLHKAVEANKLDALMETIASVKRGAVEGINLESANPQGETAFHVAIAAGWREGIEVLLAAGSDPNTRDIMQRAPLHSAVQRGHFYTVRALLQAKADANLRDEDPEHDPRYSSKSREENPDEHRTPLHYAAELGNLLAMQELLGQGHADPNALDSQKRTPLHLCLELLDPDRDVDTGNGVRVTGLQKRPEWNGRMGAVVGKKVSDAETVRWPVLLDGADDPVSIKEDNLVLLADEVVDLLLEARADVNLGNLLKGQERTALHEAVCMGNATLAKKVLTAGALIDQSDTKLGLTALHLAARAKSHELVQLLVEARANTTLKTAQGKTALEIAQTNGARPATLALLRDQAAGNVTEMLKAADTPGDVNSLTAEQRAMLFLD